MADMRDPAIFDEVLRRRIKMANAEMERMGLPAMDEEKMVAEVSAAADVLRPHITNTIPVMHEAVASGKASSLKGPRELTWMWTSAPIRSSPPPTPLPLAPAPARVFLRTKLTASSASARPTPPAWAQAPSSRRMKTSPTICTAWAANSAPPRAAPAVAVG